MHTISFYSFKGGVGRSMAVYYLAQEFAKRGKRVVVVDFDFEAPGLPYKFKIPQAEISAGLIDYIYTFFKEKRIPDSIAIDCKLVPEMGTAENPVWLLPAGASHQRGYWQKLHAIDWKQLLYQQESYGRAFFLEWKLRLEEELKPDVLLIDSRTGIHDLTAVTMHLLSDQVLVLGVNNEENIDGCRLLLEILKDTQDPILEGKAIIAHFALTRLPIPSANFSYKEEKEICKLAKERINTGHDHFSNPLVEKVLVVHSDDRLLINEKRLTEDPREDYWRIERDLLAIFYEMCRSATVLDDEQLKKLEEATQIDEYLKQAISAHQTNDFEQANVLIDKALKITPEHPDALSFKGLLFFNTKNYDHAIEYFNSAIQHQPNAKLHHIRSLLFIEAGKIDAAIADLEVAITLEPKEALHYQFRIGKISLEQGRLDNARLVSERLRLAEPSNPEFMEFAGDVEAILGNLEASSILYQKTIELSPNQLSAYGKVSGQFLKNNEPEKAKRFISIASKLSQNNVDLIRANDTLREYLRSIDQGEKAFKKLLKIAPDDMEARISLAELYFLRGKFSDSRKALSKAEKVNPADKRIVSLKKKLQGK